MPAKRETRHHSKVFNHQVWSKSLYKLWVGMELEACGYEADDDIGSIV